ncbi:MAG: hypothetical protein HUK00_00210 [Bacteroidaceae bacterium]|nr:hypothetical protein [Bacteroidaceae bacterium]MCF0193591.1 hypothetical protein [Bacteroidaceae bacterium]
MIKIKKIQNNNPKTPQFNGWSGRVINSDSLSLDTVAGLCSLNNTVTRADTIAVLDALFVECIHALKNGNSVSLGDLGSLHLTVSGPLAATLESWNVKDNIEKINVRYTPSPALKRAVSLTAEGVNVRVVD